MVRDAHLHRCAPYSLHCLREQLWPLALYLRADCLHRLQPHLRGVMTRITDEARAFALAALEADREWHKPDSMGVWRANYTRAVELVLEAALPHLTDDGAVSTPPADPTGGATPTAAERATPVPAGEAAPSSPHLEGATPVATREQIIEALRGRGILRDASNALYRGGLSKDELLDVADYLIAAGVFREGATPHRALCPTSYGEACDSYCDEAAPEGATPAIDREARVQLAAEVEPWLQECGSCDAALPMACTCPPGDYRNILLKVWRAYEAGEGATPAIDREALRSHLLSSEIIRADAGHWDTPTLQEVDRIVAAVSELYPREIGGAQ